LAGVTERLERFLDGSGLSRRAAASAPLDGKVFRVVGTVERTDLPDGSPVEVVRAAALAGDRLVREGEVLVNRRPAT
jgi:molecular chaperone GrpE (heat shock protein)